MSVCRNGHPMIGENVEHRSDGKRRCKTCDRQRRRARHAEHNAATRNYKRIAHAVHVALSALDNGNARLALTVLRDAARH